MKKETKAGWISTLEVLALLALIAYVALRMNPIV